MANTAMFVLVCPPRSLSLQAPETWPAQLLRFLAAYTFAYARKVVSLHEDLNAFLFVDPDLVRQNGASTTSGEASHHP